MFAVNKIKNIQESKDLKYYIYWDGKRVDRHIRKFIDNICLNCTTSTINDRFIKHLKLTNNLLPTLEIMKERRYDLYGDVKCRMCLEENEDDDHIIYCQQLRDKWLVVANNTRHKCDQMLKDLLSQEKYFQLN
ncbi:hypothetical protein C1646_761158 [Rhizophagus diaphanus]|nr:hypothetical protein C1646_761158 [Rhizophagus diaphanus] [Rhizophagus sp. MUCL 43196]